MDDSRPSRYPVPSADQIEVWRTFRAQRVKSARDRTDPWMAAGPQSADQLVAIREGWSIGVTRGSGRILVVDGPFQGQSVGSKQAADEDFAAGRLCRLRVKSKKATKASPATRIGLDIHLFGKSGQAR
jgi:hypothetical protein